MNKRMLIVIGLFVTITLSTFGNTADKESDNGSVKLGLLFGRSLAITVGFDISGPVEFNLNGGTSWNFSDWYVGGNVLFTVAKPRLGNRYSYLSLGPQVDFWGFDPNDYSLSALAVLRWDYTFAFPLNLFIEIGAGAGWYLGNTTAFKGFDGTFGLGARFVFD